jgi:hypothetical protein
VSTAVTKPPSTEVKPKTGVANPYKSTPPKSGLTTSISPVTPHYGCGKPHTGTCLLSGHPDYNHNKNLPWDQSPQGIAWKAKGKHSLPASETLAGAKYQAPKALPTKAKQGNDDFSIIASMLLDHITRDLIPMRLTSTSNSIDIMSLIDTGALQANYISVMVADHLKITPSGVKLLVSSGMNNLGSLQSMGNCHVMLSYFNELTKSTDTIDIACTVLDIPFDLIIGKPTLREYKLLQKVHDQFWGNDYKSVLEEKSTYTGLTATTHESLWTNQLVATILEKEDILSWAQDDSEDYFIPESSSLPLDLGNQMESTSIIPTDIHGDTDLKERLVSLCHRFEDIFSREVKPTPADIPPFDIDVDLIKWHRSSNRAPPRPMTIAKQLDLRSSAARISAICDTGPSSMSTRRA